MEQNISPEIIPNEMKVNELPNKGFKRIFLKMFYKLKETVYEQSQNINREIEIVKKEPNTNFGAEEYNNWDEKFTREVQQKTYQAEKRISKLKDRSF